jgi:hypothetical protein
MGFHEHTFYHFLLVIAFTQKSNSKMFTTFDIVSPFFQSLTLIFLFHEHKCFFLFTKYSPPIVTVFLLLKTVN